MREIAWMLLDQSIACTESQIALLAMTERQGEIEGVQREAQVVMAGR